MLGSIPADLLPIDDSGTPGRAVGSPAPIGAASPPHEPVAAPPLLRDAGTGLVDDRPRGDFDDALDPSDDPTVDDAIHELATQLAPISSRAALADSFAREANPDDPILQAAYVCAWADLGMRLMFGTTRRARNIAPLTGGRRLPARGLG